MLSKGRISDQIPRHAGENPPQDFFPLQAYFICVRVKSQYVGRVDIGGTNFISECQDTVVYPYTAQSGDNQLRRPCRS